ncbi:putative triacylglycerol lipase [Blattamonas nauphoetae]|uniref:Triacylglycerol lipase n=1 Tax=Blattamonas nauphoetae TaxID=2049346 RepID=A0ABQ9YD44_9EUKA|nr:putative triacylglycerol lipase [Blattamonas nauphoetae]
MTSVSQYPSFYYQHPKTYPILLCPGIASTNKLFSHLFPVNSSDKADGFNYFKNMRSFLSGFGFSVEVLSQRYAASVDDRVLLLKQQVEWTLEKYGANKVHLICHSMAGLDARHMLFNYRHENFHEHVASVTTIATPHHGCMYAWWILHKTPFGYGYREVLRRAIKEVGGNRPILRERPLQSVYGYVPREELLLPLNSQFKKRRRGLLDVLAKVVHSSDLDDKFVKLGRMELPLMRLLSSSQRVEKLTDEKAGKRRGTQAKRYTRIVEAVVVCEDGKGVGEGSEERREEKVGEEERGKVEGEHKERVEVKIEIEESSDSILGSEEKEGEETDEASSSSESEGEAAEVLFASKTLANSGFSLHISTDDVRRNAASLSEELRKTERKEVGEWKQSGERNVFELNLDTLPSLPSNDKSTLEQPTSADSDKQDLKEKDDIAVPFTTRISVSHPPPISPSPSTPDSTSASPSCPEEGILTETELLRLYFEQSKIEPNFSFASIELGGVVDILPSFCEEFNSAAKSFELSCGVVFSAIAACREKEGKFFGLQVMGEIVNSLEDFREVDCRPLGEDGESERRREETMERRRVHAERREDEDRMFDEWKMREGVQLNIQHEDTNTSKKQKKQKRNSKRKENPTQHHSSSDTSPIFIPTDPQCSSDPAVLSAHGYTQIETERENWNDGCVTVKSSSWCPEFFSGMVWDSDHLHEVGWGMPDAQRSGRESIPQQEQTVQMWYLRLSRNLAFDFPISEDEDRCVNDDRQQSLDETRERRGENTAQKQ